MVIKQYSMWSKRDYPYDGVVTHVPKEIILHHSLIPRQDQYGDNIVQAIQSYHIKTRGMVDIAYHYLIDIRGYVYKGREDTHKGDHCYPNTGKLGVCLIGNYDKDYDILNKKMYESLIELLRNLCIMYKIKPEKIKMHHDYDAKKTCPGETIQEMMDKIREDVRDSL
jgi:hypothetical protein